jgi:hypothetical protein
VPCAPINGYAEALADPQALHLQLVREQVLPGGHATRTVGCPVRLDGQTDGRRHAPCRRWAAARGASCAATPEARDERSRRTLAPVRGTAMTELVERTTDERLLLAEGRAGPGPPAGQRRLAARRLCHAAAATATRSTCCTAIRWNAFRW